MTHERYFTAQWTSKHKQLHVASAKKRKPASVTSSTPRQGRTACIFVQVRRVSARHQVLRVPRNDCTGDFSSLYLAFASVYVPRAFWSWRRRRKRKERRHKNKNTTEASGKNFQFDFKCLPCSVHILTQICIASCHTRLSKPQIHRRCWFLCPSTPWTPLHEAGCSKMLQRLRETYATESSVRGCAGRVLLVCTQQRQSASCKFPTFSSGWITAPTDRLLHTFRSTDFSMTSEGCREFAQFGNSTLRFGKLTHGIGKFDPTSNFGV